MDLRILVYGDRVVTKWALFIFVLSISDYCIIGSVDIGLKMTSAYEDAAL